MPEPIGIDLRSYRKKINYAIDLGKTGDFAQAVGVMSDLVAEYSEAASARGYLAWYLLELGRKDEAIQHSRRAILLAPRSEKVSLIHFQVLWQSKGRNRSSAMLPR
jgi:Flp pilus assembly protein TadD